MRGRSCRGCVWSEQMWWNFNRRDLFPWKLELKTNVEIMIQFMYSSLLMMWINWTKMLDRSDGPCIDVTLIQEVMFFFLKMNCDQGLRMNHVVRFHTDLKIWDRYFAIGPSNSIKRAERLSLADYLSHSLSFDKAYILILCRYYCNTWAPNYILISTSWMQLVYSRCATKTDLGLIKKIRANNVSRWTYLTKPRRSSCLSLYILYWIELLWSSQLGRLSTSRSEQTESRYK